VSGRTIGVISDTHGFLRPQALAIDLITAGVAAVISGHSHRPAIEERDGVLFVNPGSAGPRRFSLPVATARLRVERGTVTGEIVLLDV
jgi:predicted phosphodiesterase